MIGADGSAVLPLVSTDGVRAECLVCGLVVCASPAALVALGWQRGACTCGQCPDGAVWLCPAHRTEAQP
jgi:hypothetical protein